MNENKINELAEMLCSEDLEIIKLIVQILKNQYNLDFNVYGLSDINTGTYKYSLNIKDGYDPIFLNAEDLLDDYIRSNSGIPYYILKSRLRLAKNFIKVIIEYNERKQHK